MKLISHHVRSIEELAAIEEKFPAVFGPSPVTFAARHGLKLSKSYKKFMTTQKPTRKSTRKVAQPRRRLVAA